MTDRPTPAKQTREQQNVSLESDLLRGAREIAVHCLSVSSAAGLPATGP